MLWYSWPSLRNRNVHGFYRFYVFEILLVMILANVDRWFQDPWAAHQVLSWILLSLASATAIHGFYLLRVVGRPRGNFENTTHLVIIGAYKYIRHPLYGSLLALVWGIFFKDASLPGVLLAAVATLFLYATAKTEETENLTKFGIEYSDYMKSTRMFIPYVF